MQRFVPRFLVVVCLAGAVCSLPYRSTLAPALTLIGLLWAVVPLGRAWLATDGTALRPALVWAGITIGIAAFSQLQALIEPFETGRPVSGHLTYLSTISAFATLIGVLNARKPGGGPWAILMALLAVVFLVPWLEGSGLVREGNGWDRLRLNAPWTIFYGLLVIAGVTNYAPTRFGISSLILATGFVLEYLGLTRLEWSHETRGILWTAVPLCWACAAWLADVETLKRSDVPPGLGRLWAWFRNGWGVVWALRTQERFNRAAESSGWPIRLTWQGVTPLSSDSNERIEIPEAATATLISLLRRFATTDVLKAVSSQDD